MPARSIHAKSNIKIKKYIECLPLAGMVIMAGLAIIALRTLPSSASDSVVSEISVTVQPSCTLTNESDLGSSSNSSIKTLQPGTYDPNIHTITLTSNCNDVYDSQIFAIGYTGCNGNNDDDCLASNANINLVGQTSGAAISGLTPFPTDGETDPTSFTTSGWYMKVSPNSTDTWQFTPENNFNTFRTIPSTSTLIAKTTITTNQITKPTSTLTTTYSAYASPSQIADTYEGKVKYTLITSKVTFPYIQDLTLDQCKVNVGTNGNPANIGDNLTVIDIRDGNDYTVRYINGYCWMTQNLRFVGDAESATMTLSHATSNVDEEKTFTYYDLAAEGAPGGKCNGADATADNPLGYSTACAKDSSNATTGVWYNYAAATATTVTGYQNSESATEDVCPKNWHLPTGPNTTSGTDFNRLVGNTTSGWQNPTTGLSAFGAVAGGRYYDGSLRNTGRGYWRAASARNAYDRYDLIYTSSDEFYGDADARRYYGLFVRCVRTS